MDLSKNFDGKMEYSKDFIKKCLALYPNNEKIIDLLSRKSYLLKEELIQGIEKADSNKKEKEDLYNEFNNLYKEQYLSRNLYIDEKYGTVSEVLVHFGNIEREKKIPLEELASLERNSRKMLQQNKSRRNIGSDVAAKYISD